jgi:hypothetical protein
VEKKIVEIGDNQRIFVDKSIKHLLREMKACGYPGR